MPVLNGHQFMLAFRKRPEAASTPVIALTANCDEVSAMPSKDIRLITNDDPPKATKQKCMDEGFSYFLSKPLSIQNLTSTLDRIYETKRVA